MAEEKKIQTQVFLGGLDSDSARELVKPECYTFAQNIRIFSTNNSNRGIVTNTKGNVQISFTKPEGLNITIGAKANPEKNKLIFFNWNENGYHVIYIYDLLLNQVYPVIRNLTDTNNVDILKFKRRSLILHIDWVGDLVYWVDGQVKQKKFNVLKALDKSTAGYGDFIKPDYINAYKLAPIFPAKLAYFTDTSRLTNYLYANLYKASYRFIFDDGEKSVWAEFSTVPLPKNESFTGNASVSNVNNCLKISVETGNKTVNQLEIAIKSGLEDFVSIVTLDKRKLSISNDSLYVYSFYNENTSYSGLNQIDVFKAYSFMPDVPKVQAFVDKAMVYGGGSEGFEVVDVDLDVAVVYSDLFLSSATPNELNDPYFDKVDQEHDYVRNNHIFGLGNGYRRNIWVKFTVGHDVKAGNHFEMFGQNGESDNLYFDYVATSADDAISVANAFKQQLIVTGRILESSEDLPASDIWANTINGSGDVSFTFILRGRWKEQFTSFSGRVNPVSFQTLKDNGQSVGNHKSGGSVKYALVYWNEDTKRSAAYTSDDAFVRTNFMTESSGFKKVVHNLSIRHLPPIWAQYYSVVRTVDLTYGTDYIQILIQKAIESTSTTNTEYVDLVIGSLFTYQRMYPNTPLTFNFEKNDRVRLMKKETGGTLYSFLETVVLDYSDNIIEDKNEDITTNNTNTVTIGGTTSVKNIGRIIEIDGIERTIIAAPSGTTYTMDRAFGTAQKYTSYKVIDRRGIIRVRKPVGVTIEDSSLIEVYKPTQNVESVQKNFYHFGHKYAIKDWGTANRVHTGNTQNQNPASPSATPAIVAIGNGMSYTRQRQLPTNNIIPDTQAIVDLIEDKSFSDAYVSELNDNGKVSPEDDGRGVKLFPERLRFSRNYIEDSLINGLNDFDNLDRKDYNDPYGAFMLLVYREGILYAFKYLKTGYIPILADVLQGDDGSAIGLGASKTLLNKLQYFAHEGGIGKNPESHASHETWQWFASSNSGTLCRTGGDGILPISEQFDFDSEAKIYLKRAEKYNAFILGGFDTENNEYVPSFEQPKEYLSNGEFSESEWDTFFADLATGTIFEITTNAAHGTVVVGGDGKLLWTPTTNYVGTDFFFFRYQEPGGAWSAPMKRCLRVDDVPIPSSPSIFYNAALTVAFTRSNCNTGYHGSSVNYIVPQYKYSSYINQPSADQQATDDANANGQAFANDPANGGTCTINGPTAYSFTDLTGLERSTLTESGAQVISGSYDFYAINALVGTEYQIDGGAWTSLAGSIPNGSSVKLRKTTSGSFSTALSVTVSIGGVTDTWSITTRAALPVTVNWDFYKDQDPHVDMVLVPLRNGVNIGNIYPTSTGTFTGTVGGDSMYMGIVHQTAYQPWPLLAQAKMTIKKDGVDIFASGWVTNPTLEDLAHDTFVLEEGSVYDVICVSESSSTDYISGVLSLDNNSSAPLSVSTVIVGFTLIDHTDNNYIFNSGQSVDPQNNMGINWFDDAALGKLHLVNNFTYGLVFRLYNTDYGGGYDQTITVAGGGGTGDLDNIPKTSYKISYIDEDSI